MNRSDVIVNCNTVTFVLCNRIGFSIRTWVIDIRRGVYGKDGPFGRWEWSDKGYGVAAAPGRATGGYVWHRGAARSTTCRLKAVLTRATGRFLTPP